MGTWFFTMKQHHYRTGEVIAMKTGVVSAEREEEAQEKVWELFGGNNCSQCTVVEVADGVHCHTVYKNEVR